MLDANTNLRGIWSNPAEVMRAVLDRKVGVVAGTERVLLPVTLVCVPVQDDTPLDSRPTMPSPGPLEVGTPRPGDLNPSREPHARRVLCVGDEALHRCDAPGSAGDSAVQAYCQHLGCGGAPSR